MKVDQIVRLRLGLKLFPQFTKILGVLRTRSHTFDVDIIMNTLVAKTKLSHRRFLL
jgi:hypothetical protein